MRASAAALAILTCGACLGVVACGGSKDEAAPPAARTPIPAPSVTLTSEEKQVWAKLPPDRSAIPVLLYHGIGPESNFANAADASYGIAADDFAKQMTEIQHAGYETIDLQTFLDFVGKKPVDLPPRPLLLTFDDARADSWTGGDAILKKLQLHRGHVRRRRSGRRRRSRVPHLEGARERSGQRPVAAAAALRQGSHADPVRPRRRRLRAVLRLQGTGRGLRRLAEARALRHRMGPGARSPTTSPPTSRSPSRRRTAATARTAPTTRRSPTISSAGSRTATTRSSRRT